MARGAHDGNMTRRMASAVAVAVILIGAAVGCATPLHHAKPAEHSQVSPAARIPVIACPSKYGLPGTPPTRVATAELVPLPTTVANRLDYYSDQARSVRPILGPRGWSCRATVGADQSVDIQVYPPGGSSRSPGEVDVRDDAPCVGCMYSDACPLIPHVAAELRYVQLPCPATRPARETVTWVTGSSAFSKAGDDIVSFTDPPGVHGTGTPSGGPYYTRGMLMFSWSPGTNSNVSVLNCALPDKDRALCTAILKIFTQANWTAY